MVRVERWVSALDAVQRLLVAAVLHLSLLGGLDLQVGAAFGHVALGGADLGAHGCRFLVVALGQQVGVLVFQRGDLGLELAELDRGGFAARAELAALFELGDLGHGSCRLGALFLQDLFVAGLRDAGVLVVLVSLVALVRFSALSGFFALFALLSVELGGQLLDLRVVFDGVHRVGLLDDLGEQVVAPVYGSGVGAASGFVGGEVAEEFTDDHAGLEVG